MKALTTRQESQINEAATAGIKPARIAELINCTEAQVLATIELYRRLHAERDAWGAIIEAEKAKGS